MHVGEVQIEENDDEKLLGTTVDEKFTFKKHAQAICKRLVKSFMHIRVFQSTWKPRS